jgi:hypothetical protein
MNTGAIVYSAAAMSRILGLPCECSDPVPEAADGEIVIYYGGWDLDALRSSVAGKMHMWQNSHYNEREWKVAEPGYYKIILPVPDSNRKPREQQVAHMRTISEGFQPAPIVVAASAALVHLMETGNSLLKEDSYYMCDESRNEHKNYHVGLMFRRDLEECLVDIQHRWDGAIHNEVWLAAAKYVARTLP